MPFAAFFDILGTSRYFTSLPDNYDFNKDGSEFTGYRYARKIFHEAIVAATEIAKKGLTFRASFSDCAYLVYDEANGISLASAIIMRWVYSNVPLRGGIGYGNFGLGGTIHKADDRSLSTEASFFGSALVRAHAAEGCGLKGFRVFIHSSAVDELKKTHEDITVYPEIDLSDFDDDEMPPTPTVGGTVIELDKYINPNVRHELCFIGHENIELYFRKIDMLENKFPPTESDLIHYEESRLALQRFHSLREAI